MEIRDEYERMDSGGMDADRLLRRLGASRKLTGFRYAEYMVEQVRADPERIRLITKRLYPDTGRTFRVTPGSVERDVRTLVQYCGARGDRAFFSRVACVPLRYPPSNSEFIDMLAAYLR